jgi:hypothetical protein
MANTQTLIANLPEDAKRVKVTDSAGNTRWRDKEDVRSTDTIQCKKDGSPITMANSPGRPSKSVNKPKTRLPDPKTDEVAEWVRQRESMIAKDPIIECLIQNPDSIDLIDLVLREMAKEASSLEYDKIVLEREGLGVSGVSNHRLKALRTLGETWMKKKREIDASTLDLNSPAFRALFSQIMKTFEQAMEKSGMPPEMIQLVFDQLSKLMDAHWEQEAKTKVRNTIRGVPA